MKLFMGRVDPHVGSDWYWSGPFRICYHLNGLGGFGSSRQMFLKFVTIAADGLMVGRSDRVKILLNLCGSGWVMSLVCWVMCLVCWVMCLVCWVMCLVCCVMCLVCWVMCLVCWVRL